MANELPVFVAPSIGSEKVPEAVAYLQRKRSDLRTFHDVEDLACAEPERKDLLHFFGILKSALAKTLWPKQFFIGSSILDELLFEALCDPNISDPFQTVLSRIKAAGVHEPGIVLYPLHSFGILGFGFMQFLNSADAYIDLPEAGMCLTTQTNSIAGTVKFLNHARELFGIDQTIPVDAIKHHRRVSLDWLESNQLLAVKVSTFSGYAYENQPLLTIKLEMSTALVFMLSVLEPPRDEEVLRGSSSSRSNNFQTLDINHYLTLERSPKPSTELNARRIPMNIKRTELINLCDLQVDLDPEHWSSKPPILERLVVSLTELEKGYTRLSVSGLDNGVQARIYRKIFDALGFFRRSFHSQARKGEPAIFLATAFEMLLTDHFTGGVEPRLKRRFKIATASEPEAAGLEEIVGTLYKRRSETVHEGKVNGKLDLRLAQKAFVFAFIGTVSALGNLPNESPEPLAEMFGDIQKKGKREKFFDGLIRIIEGWKH